MNNFLDSLYNYLCDLYKSIDTSTLKNSFIDNFVHELRDYVFRADSLSKLTALPKDTLLDINEIESDYVQCYFNGIEYPVPKNIIYSPDLEGLKNNGFVKLQLKDDNLYHVIRYSTITGKII